MDWRAEVLVLQFLKQLVLADLVDPQDVANSCNELLLVSPKAEWKELSAGAMNKLRHLVIQV